MEGVLLGAGISFFVPPAQAFTRTLLQVDYKHDYANDVDSNIGKTAYGDAASRPFNATARNSDQGTELSSHNQGTELRNPIARELLALTFSNTSGSAYLGGTSVLNDTFFSSVHFLNASNAHETGAPVVWLEQCQSNSSSAWKLTSPVCSTQFASFLAFSFVTLLLSVITLWTILGNVLVLWALYRYRYLRTMSNCLIGNLAVSDLLLAITVLPISTGNDLLGYWVFGRTMCTVWLCIDVLYCTASIWGLCTIAFDRYTATVYPMWYHDKRSTRKALAYMVFVWVFSVVISIAPFIGWRDMISNFYRYNPDINRHMCVLFSTKSYVIYSAMGSFVLPSIFMTFLYIKIFAVLHRQSHTLKKKTSVTTMCDSPSRLLTNGECPTIFVSSTTHDPVSCAVTRDVTASTFIAEDTFIERGDDDDEDDDDDDRVLNRRARDLSDDEDDEDELSSSKCEYSPTRTEFDLEDACAIDDSGKSGGGHSSQHRGFEPLHISTNSRYLADDVFALRDQRSNSLHVEMETTFLRASEGGGTGGGGGGDNNNSLLLSGPDSNRDFLTVKRDFLTVSTSDIPLQCRLKKSRSAAFDLQDAGKELENGRNGRRSPLMTLSVPRSKSASTLCVGAHCRTRKEGMQNGGGGSARRGGSVGGGTGMSSLSLHRLSLLWPSRRPQQMTTSMKRRFQLREQRATKRMLLIMLCFYVCWVPFTLMYMLRSLCEGCPVLDDHLTACIIWLGYANSSLNPLLYTLFNDDFRKAFKKLLRFNRLRRPS